MKQLKYKPTPEEKKKDKEKCEILMSKIFPEIVKDPFTRNEQVNQGYLTRKERDRILTKEKARLMVEGMMMSGDKLV